MKRIGNQKIEENRGVANVFVELGRELVTGESLTVPLKFTGATHGTHYQVALAATEGVTMATSGAYSEQNPALTFTAGSLQALIILTSLPNDDMGEKRTITVTPGTPTVSYLLSLGGGAEADGSASISITDDDVPVIAPTSVTLNEAPGAGSSAIYTVTLNEAPLTARTIAASVKDHSVAEIEIVLGDQTFRSGSSLIKFTPEDWTPKEIRVLVQDDDVDNPGNKRDTTITHHVIGGIRDFTGKNGAIDSVAVTVNDDDGPPVFAVRGDAKGTETDGVEFTILRGGASGNDVNVKWRLKADTTANANAATIADDFRAPRSGSLRFRPGVTEVPVILNTGDTIDEPDETFILELYDPDAGTSIDSTRSTATGTILDDDIRGVTVTPAEVTVPEKGVSAGHASYRIDITSGPDAPITVTATVDDPSIAQVHFGGNKAGKAQDSATVTWAKGDYPYTVERTVVVSGVDDAVDNPNNRRETTITHTVSGGDYDGLVIAKVKVIVTDDDGPATFAIADATAEEGKPVEFTITRSQGTSDVATVNYVTAAATGDNAAATSDYTAQTTAETVTFGAYEITKTISVATTDDKLDESDETFLVKLSGADVSDGEAIGTITDNDTRGVTISKSTLTVVEPVGSDTYTVVLDTKPIGTDAVTVTVTSSDTTAVTVDKPTLTFTPYNWNMPQTVRAKVVNDDIDNPGNKREAKISHTASGADYGSVTGAEVEVTLTDDDQRGSVVNPTRLNLDEDGGQGTYSITLASQPSESVTINITARRIDRIPPIAADGVVVLDKSSLTFTPDNWRQAQTVTVTAVDNEVDEQGRDQVKDLIVTHRVAQDSGGDYKSINLSQVRLLVTDDDDSGVVISPPVVNIDEGAEVTYTVVLTSQPPSSGVTVSLDAGTAPVTLSATQLKFTTGNWSTPQTVTVTADDDDIDFEHPDVTADWDSAYSIQHGISAGYIEGYVAPAALVTKLKGYAAETQHGDAHVQRWQSALEGLCVFDYPGVAPMTLARARQLQTQHGGRWNEVVTALDAKGSAKCPDLTRVRVTVNDDDVRGVKLSTTEMTLWETDNPNTSSRENFGFYSITLTSKPTKDVEIKVVPTNSQTTAISWVPKLPQSHTFTPATWNVPKPVLITANKDSNTFINRYTINHGVVSTGDYDGVKADELFLTVTDTDGKKLSLTSGTALEGEKVAFTVSRGDPAVTGFRWVSQGAAPGKRAGTDDYTNAEGRVIFGSRNSATFYVQTTEDDIDEDNEHFGVTVYWLIDDGNGGHKTEADEDDNVLLSRHLAPSRTTTPAASLSPKTNWCLARAVRPPIRWFSTANRPRMCPSSSTART